MHRVKYCELLLNFNWILQRSTEDFFKFWSTGFVYLSSATAADCFNIQICRIQVQLLELGERTAKNNGGTRTYDTPIEFCMKGSRHRGEFRLGGYVRGSRLVFTIF